jgi:hypothetical protein
MKASIVLAFLFATAFAADFKLPAGCTLPFSAIAPTKDAHLSCGNDGSGLGGTVAPKPKILEDIAKNNFCADASHPVTVTFKDLRDMQAKSPDKKPLENPNNPSRDSLKNFYSLNGQKIGEGTVVHLAAFIKEAHISDCTTTSSGEEVNCKMLGIEHNDFHIPLLDPTAKNPAAQDECTSVTAEMSPHFRPAAWNNIDTKTPTKYPVRVTGPLFFDDSHEPCTISATGKITKTANPKRSSLWEIHPVYSLEICSNIDPAECDVNSTSKTVWIPYDQWITTHAADVTATGSKQRSACISAAGKQTSTTEGKKSEARNGD